VDGCHSHHSPPTPFVHSWPHSWTVATVTTRHPPHSCIRGPIRGRLPQSPLATHPIRAFVAPFVDGCPTRHTPPTPFVYSWPHSWTVAPPNLFVHSWPYSWTVAPPTPFVHSWPHSWTVAPLATCHPPHSCIHGPIRGRLLHPNYSCIRGPIRGRLPHSPFVYSWPHSWTVAPPHSCIRGPIRGRLPQSPLATHPIRAFVVPFVDGCPTRHSPSKPICRRSCFFVVFVVFVVGLMFAVWKSDWYQG
jgi:hypothetical protein